MWLPKQQQIQHIKVGFFFLALIPLFRLVYLTFNDALGANPIEFIERSTGTWALVMLLISLSITPLKLLAGLAWPVQFRRMFGLFMFFYACLHISIYLWLDYSFDWQEITKDIIKHPYVLVGFSAFLLSIPLAATSNQRMIKALKQKWKSLHKLSYVIAILGVVHFLWLVKKDLTEPLIYTLVLCILFGIRVINYYQRNAQ